MKDGKYTISSDFQCDLFPKHMTHHNSALRGTLEEAKEYIEDAVKKYRASWSVRKEIDLE